MKHYVCFKTLHKDYGKIQYPNKITIDLCDFTNPIRTYLHELIHMKNPDWKENKVRREEKRLWNRMSNHDKFILGKKLFNRTWRRPW